MASRSQSKTNPRHYPKAREVLGCDFRGLIKPEMSKRSPVIILSYSQARPGLAAVVPLSTTEPKPQQSWHYLLSQASQWDRRQRWVKADMIYTVSLSRLFRWRIGTDNIGSQIYLRNFRVSENDFCAIQDAVLSALKITRP